MGLSYLFLFNSYEFNFQFIKQNKKALLSFNYLTNFTAGLTFFIAVAATNLFHQGNWQRVYAAQNNGVLKKSLIISFLIIIPIVFLMGFSGLVAVSASPVLGKMRKRNHVFNCSSVGYSTMAASAMAAEDQTFPEIPEPASFYISGFRAKYAGRLFTSL